MEPEDALNADLAAIAGLGMDVAKCLGVRGAARGDRAPDVLHFAWHALRVGAGQHEDEGGAKRRCQRQDREHLEVSRTFGHAQNETIIRALKSGLARLAG